MLSAQQLLALLLSPFALCPLSAAPPHPSPGTHHPNLVLILADDLGWSDTSILGAKLIATPTLDRLAREGTVFSQFYATPTCAPTRHVLITGQYGPRHGNFAVDGFSTTPAPLKRVIGIRSSYSIPDDTKTLGEILRAAGYATATIGKWHIGDGMRDRAEQRGFDLNIGGTDAGSPKSFFAPYGNIPIEPKTSGEYLTTRLTDEAVDYLRQPHDKPFFLYLPGYAVHVPLQAPKDFFPADSGEPALDAPVPLYVAMVRHYDHCIGRILAAIETLPKDRPTVVMFTSDNGGQLLCTSNRPLRGQKGTVYEGGIRVPALLWSPGLVPAGRTIETPAAIQDILPTLAAFASAPLPTGQPVDGQDLTPLLHGKPIPRDALFWHLPNYNGNLKSNARIWQPPVSVIRLGDWKLIQHLDEPTVELYNIAADIGETNNLSGTEPKVVADLSARLKQWQKEIAAPIPTEANLKFDPSKVPAADAVNRRTPNEWRNNTGTGGEQ